MTTKTRGGLPATSPKGGLTEGPRKGTDMVATLHTCPGTKASVAATTFPNGRTMVYLLTSCCGASAKGSEAGTVCRGCYKPVKDAMDWSAMSDDAGVLASLIGVMWATGCPCPSDCADIALSAVEAQLLDMSERAL